MTIGMLGASGRQPGTVLCGYVSLVPYYSFLVRKESFRASITRSGKEEHVISVQFLGSQQDVSTSRMKKRNKSRMILRIVATGP